MKVLKKSEKGALLQFLYKNDITVNVLIKKQPGWFYLKLVKSNNIKEVDAVRWGPIYTNIIGGVGEFAGMLHADKSTLGMMSLEENTDAKCIDNNGHVNLKTTPEICAEWFSYPSVGSYLLLDSIDHTRVREVFYLVNSQPVKKTVLGSKVALYLAEKGKELDLIENIVKKEGLPYLTLDGVWIRKSVRMKSPSVWGSYGEKDADKYIKLCHQFDGSVVSSFSRMFGNWGHFEIDPKLYPNGVPAVIKASETAIKYGIHMNMHTLTNFIKPVDIPEPFITPKIDPRFLKYSITTKLLKGVDEKNQTITITMDDKLKKLFANRKGDTSIQHRIVLKLNNEIILFKKNTIGANSITLSDCERGYLMTKPVSHKAGDVVGFLYYSGYNNIFAGNLDMLFEVAGNIARTVDDCHITKVSLDGHESCCFTGHSCYSMNKVLKIIYEKNKKREMIYTGSRITNYCINMMGYLSWGEYDLDKGFRGTMLDYRINRQIQLERSLIPHKLGQHYPSKATLEDINWLMAQAVGWNGGVELSVNLGQFNRNPQKDAIIKAVHKWEQVRKSGTVSKLQKYALSQIDRVYDVEKSGKGWKLIPVQTHWTDSRCKVLPASAIKLKDLSSDKVAEKRTIDMKWTHSPLIYKEAALSNDIPMIAGQENKWDVTFPSAAAKQGGGICGNQFKFVLRVPETSKCGIKNPIIGVNNGQFVMIPAEIKPGQYIATPLHIPVAFLYDKDHNVIGKYQIKYSNHLPDIVKKVKFNFTCKFDSLKDGVNPIAVMNVFYTNKL